MTTGPHVLAGTRDGYTITHFEILQLRLAAFVTEILFTPSHLFDHRMTAQPPSLRRFSFNSKVATKSDVAMLLILCCM